MEGEGGKGREGGVGDVKGRWWLFGILLKYLLCLQSRQMVLILIFVNDNLETMKFLICLRKEGTCNCSCHQ